MVFSSLVFLFYFLPATVILYTCTPRKLKNLCLFIASLLFYAWGEPVYIILMLVSTITDFIIGLLIERADHNQKVRKLLLLTSIIANLGVLGFFKYYAFLAQNIELATGILMPNWDPPLPIGISFYTFQTLSYTIDVYRRKVSAQHNFISFGCFVALFPQLIAGPIVRYQDIENELNHRRITGKHLVEGSKLFLIGLGKKVLLANNIGALWAEVQAVPSTELTAGTAWLGMTAFAFQIYFDFSGYSDMARGIGKMFGFRFPVNFNYPYAAQSITDFWRRWHMTLGTWFREYVYIPLGGNRVGKLRLVRNILMVWLLTGLWHGASWNYIFWGLYFAVILWAEKFYVLKWLAHSPRIIRHSYTGVLILLGWVLFSLESMTSIGDYLLGMIGLKSGMYDHFTLYLFTSYSSVFLLCIVGSTSIPARLYLKLALYKHRGWGIIDAMAYVALLLLSIAYLVDATYNPFLYFRF